MDRFFAALGEESGLADDQCLAHGGMHRPLRTMGEKVHCQAVRPR
jgi:hypothetical protein